MDKTIDRLFFYSWKKMRVLYFKSGFVLRFFGFIIKHSMNDERITFDMMQTGQVIYNYWANS